ncbi:MAG: alpha/beta hydrolase family protein [Planctomycetota bacterium]|jgi:pimeloyl-ACP methyl ester carboxylesterase
MTENTTSIRYVYLHPLFDERKCAYRFCYLLSETFFSAGIVLERFDYRGTGEAPGDFPEVSIGSLREDVTEHIDGDNVCLIGTRIGGGLCLDYYLRNPSNVKRIVMISPIVDGSAYVNYLRRKQQIKDLMTGPANAPSGKAAYENIEGYKTSSRFIDELVRFNPLSLTERFTLSAKAYIIHIQNHTTVAKERDSLVALLGPSSRETVAINKKMPSFWERICFSDYTSLTDTVLGCCRD